MRYSITILVIFIMGVLICSCNEGNRINSEISARQAVEAFIEKNKIDVSGLEYYFTKEIDTSEKQTASRISDFGNRVWLVRYGPARGKNRKMSLGGGKLFWIDGKTGKIVIGPDE